MTFISITVCNQISQLLKSMQITKDRTWVSYGYQEGRESHSVHISIGTSLCSQERIVVNSPKRPGPRIHPQPLLSALGLSSYWTQNIPQCNASSHSSKGTFRETPAHPLRKSLSSPFQMKKMGAASLVHRKPSQIREHRKRCDQ